MRSDRLDEPDALGEVSHEREGADALRQPRDLPEAHHEALLLAQPVRRSAPLLEVLDQLHFVVGGDEALEELQEVQAEGSQVVPVDGDVPSVKPPQADLRTADGRLTSRWRSRCRPLAFLPSSGLSPGFWPCLAPSETLYWDSCGTV